MEIAYGRKTLGVAFYIFTSNRIFVEVVRDLSAEATIYRRLSGEIAVDVMPTDANILDFNDRCYVLTIGPGESFVSPNGLTINLITAATFIAAKLELFKGLHRLSFSSVRKD